MPVKTVEDFEDIMAEDQYVLGAEWMARGIDVPVDTAWHWELLGGALVADFHSQILAEIVGGDARRIARATDATRRIIGLARDDRPPPPPVRVVGQDDPFDPEESLLEGVVLAGGRSGSLPIIARIRDYFRRRNEAKQARLDTLRTYPAFRAEQSAGMQALRQRVAELEAAVAAHTADGHGPASVTLLGAVAEEVAALREEADPAKKRVPLSLPPWVEPGTWDCWREGDVVCCSIAVPGSDGEARILTSATPVRKHVEDVVGYARACGCDVEEMVGVLPTIACMMAGSSLLPTLAKSVPGVLARPEAEDYAPAHLRIVPLRDSSVAALSALFRRAQAGDEGAADEWRTLAGVAEAGIPEVAEAMSRARDAVVRVQKRGRA